jgi:glucokinase
MAVPGPMSVSRGALLAPPNLPGWRNVPVAQWMREASGRPVFLNNDANAAALAEYLYGEYRGTPDLVYLTLSTGIGAGIVADGRLIQGARDLAGEIGHYVLDRDGPPCPCGQRGCLEMYCGGGNVARRLRERIAAGARSRALDIVGGHPERLDFRALVAAAREGDALAVEFWTEFVERLAQGIGATLMFFNPSVVVLGTIAIHTGEFLLGPLRAALPRFAWDVSREGVAIAPSALGEKIGDLAALAVAIQGASDSAADGRPRP